MKKINEYYIHKEPDGMVKLRLFTKTLLNISQITEGVINNHYALR